MVSAAGLIHGVHPYPCKFPASAALVHLSDNQVVLDPFCGSGTTLVEAIARGNRVIGLDSNPIAILISRFKVLPADATFVGDAGKVLERLRTESPALKRSRAKLHSFAGQDHWFPEAVQRELAAALRWLERQTDDEIKTWLRTALSAVVNRVSLQDSETRYARIERDIHPGAVTDAWVGKAEDLLRALDDRGPFPRGAARVEQCDVRDGIPLDDATVDLIVTSPPYANTMDYYLYHKQRMNILGLDFKTAQRSEIGSRWEYSSLKAPAEKWRIDFAACLAEMRRVLVPRGRAIVIIGDSQIAGALIDANELTHTVGTQLGFHVVTQQSTPMAGASRSFNHAFQRPNKFEHVIELTLPDSPR